MRVSKGYGSSDDGPSRTSKGMTMETLDGLKSKLFGRMTKADKRLKVNDVEKYIPVVYNFSSALLSAA